MNGKLFVDTNVIIELLSGNKMVAGTLVDFEIFVSFVTVIELLSNPNHSKANIKIIQELLSNFTIIETINSEIQNLASEYRRKKIIKKTPDAIIAATAKFLKLPLLTFDAEFDNIRDFDVVLLKSGS